MRRDARKYPPTHPRDTSGVHLWLVLLKASRAIQAHAFRSLAAQPLGFSDFAVLEALLHKGPLPVNTIGRKVQLTSGSITAAVDRLEAQGLLERRPHATDRRARVVHLTKEGRRLIETVFADHERDMENAASVLSRDERATLIALLKKLGHAAARALVEDAEQEAPPERREVTVPGRRPGHA
jgi:MarR family 2-MHQ and catechol resistance regulon transcriptional repressor